MDKVITVFVSADAVNDKKGIERIHDHEDIQKYLKKEYPNEEYTVVSIQAAPMPPYLAVTYILARKKDFKGFA